MCIFTAETRSADRPQTLNITPSCIVTGFIMIISAAPNTSSEVQGRKYPAILGGEKTKDSAVSVWDSGPTSLNRCLGMQNTAEWMLLPIGLNNTARFTGTRVTSAPKNVTRGGGTWRAEWQHVDGAIEAALGRAH